MNKFICLDTETGGITPGTSLLTAFFGIFDEEFNLVDEIYFSLKPEDDNYVVTAQALEINKINLIEHNKIAILYKDAKTPLYEFLKKNYQGEKLIPVGHGIYFDVLRIKQHLISQGSWETFVSYKTLDTGVIFNFLKILNIFPNDASGSLDSLLTMLNIPSIGELHNCKIDALQTMSVLKAFVSKYKNLL